MRGRNEKPCHSPPKRAIVTAMESTREYTLSPEDALAALQWQVEMGVDDAILDAPIDRTALEAKKPKPQAAPQPSAPLAPVAKPAEDPVQIAQKLAQSAQDREALHAAMAGFTGSELREAAQNCVFSDGHPSARVMIIGEAPGRDEDRAGRPFVGRAGQLLDKMLAAIHLDRLSDQAQSAAYITNVLPWRPPQNRTPTHDEIAMFLPFLQRHIELIAPEVIMVMGNTPCQALLGRSGITRLRGTWAQVQGIPVLPSFHPAYLLRNPAAKRDAWADLLALRAKLRAT